MTHENIIGVQTKYAPKSICFGCGPANTKGLRIQSTWENDDFVLWFTPKEEHQAFPGVINGGIIGTLFDCHSNWCAATTLFKTERFESVPVTVTANFTVNLLKPTPFGIELKVIAHPTKVEGNKVWTEAKLYAGDTVTATCTGLFIAVKEGHPAYHRWD